MNENNMISVIDEQIKQLRYHKTLWGYKRDIFGKDFEYSKLDAKILSWEKWITYNRWLAAILTSVLLIASLIQVFQNFNDVPKDYLSNGANFVLATISTLVVYYTSTISLENAKTIKFLMGAKEDLVKEKRDNQAVF